MSELSIVHTADWHLGESFSGFHPSLRDVLRRERRRVIAEMTERIASLDCDLLVLCGDLFDRADAAAEDRQILETFLHRVQAKKVVILPGNHDPSFGDSTWDRLRYPEDKVYIVRENHPHLDFPSLNLRLFARPFRGKTARENFFKGSLVPLKNAFNVYLAHGELVADGGASYYQPIERGWLAKQRIDAALLGHIHQGGVITLDPFKTPVVYAGNPMGRSFGETGVKGFYHLILDDAGGHLRRDLSFKALSGPRFFKHSIVLDEDLDNLQEVRDFILQNLKALQGYRGKRDLLRLTLQGSLQGVINPDYLKEQLHHDLFYVEVTDELSPQIDEELLQKEMSFLGAFYREKEKALTFATPEEKVIIERAFEKIKRATEALSS